MKEFRSAKKRIEVSVGESVRILRELRELLLRIWPLSFDYHRLNAHENGPTYAHESCPTRCARQHPRMRVWLRMNVRNTLIWQAQGFPLQSRC